MRSATKPTAKTCGDSRGRVRRDRRADAVLAPQPLDRVAGGHPDDVEADDPGRERRRHRRDEPHLRQIGEPLLEARGERADPLRHLRPPEPGLVVERLRQRPTVLEGVVATWRERGAGVVDRRERPVLQPAEVPRTVEARNHRLHPLPRLDAPDDARAARPAEPLVAARGQHVERLDAGMPVSPSMPALTASTMPSVVAVAGSS
jgi:hypothetical protein